MRGLPHVLAHLHHGLWHVSISPSLRHVSAFGGDGFHHGLHRYLCATPSVQLLRREFCVAPSILLSRKIGITPSIGSRNLEGCLCSGRFRLLLLAKQAKLRDLLRIVLGRCVVTDIIVSARLGLWSGLFEELLRHRWSGVTERRFANTCGNLRNLHVSNRIIGCLQCRSILHSVLLDHLWLTSRCCTLRIGGFLCWSSRWFCWRRDRNWLRRWWVRHQWIRRRRIQDWWC
mmetsp:Transcript_52847/g.141163  ORF Transcript_52847/g.141163 Transcript_52847/m.141163 type:complete len:230 (+) Transcript_52847:1654-2343(+)